MSSVYGMYDGYKGVDGNTNQDFSSDHTCFHTLDTPLPSWWRVDLTEDNKIVTVVLYNRLDERTDRAKNVKLIVGRTLQTMEVVAHVQEQIYDIHTFRFIDGLIGRFVQVELIERTYLHLCEVQVFAIQMQNVAEGKQTVMSSIYGDIFAAENGVDGNTNQYSITGSFFHTSNTHQQPWWQVDLGSIYDVFEVVLFNQLYQRTAQRTHNLDLLAGRLATMAVIAHVPDQIDDIHTFRFPEGIMARYVNVTLYGYNMLHLCEVQVFGYDL